MPNYFSHTAPQCRSSAHRFVIMLVLISIVMSLLYAHSAGRKSPLLRYLHALSVFIFLLITFASLITSYMLCAFLQPARALSHLIFVSGSFFPFIIGMKRKSNEFFILCVYVSVFFLCEPTTQHVGFRGLFQNVVINNRYFWLLVFFYILVFLCAAGRTGVRFSRHLDF